MNEEGKLVGQILANFYLKKYVRDPATRKIKNYIDPIMKATLAEFSDPTQTADEVNIKFAIFGIRNLCSNAVLP